MTFAIYSYLSGEVRELQNMIKELRQDSRADFRELKKDMQDFKVDLRALNKDVKDVLKR